LRRVGVGAVRWALVVLLGRPEPPFRTGLNDVVIKQFYHTIKTVFFFRQPNLRGPSADRRETLPHDRNLVAIAG